MRYTRSLKVVVVYDRQVTNDPRTIAIAMYLPTPTMTIKELRAVVERRRRRLYEVHLVLDVSVAYFAKL